MDRHVDALRSERLSDRFDDLQLHEHSICDDHDAPKTELTHAGAEPQRRVRADEYRGTRDRDDP